MNSINEVFRRICEEKDYERNFDVFCNGRIIMLKNQDYLIYADQSLVRLTCQKRFLFWRYTRSVTNEYLQDFQQMYREIVSLADQLTAGRLVTEYPVTLDEMEEVHSFS